MCHRFCSIVCILFFNCFFTVRSFPISREPLSLWLAFSSLTCNTMSQVYASGNCILWYLLAARTKYEQKLGARSHVASSKTGWGGFWCPLLLFFHLSLLYLRGKCRSICSPWWLQARVPLCLDQAKVTAGRTVLLAFTSPSAHPICRFAITFCKADWIIFISRDWWQYC